MDLPEMLKCAIDAQADEIRAAGQPYAGRISFHVDADCNVTMHRITVRVRPVDADCAMDTKAA
jgi:hypothetical protein